MQDLRLGPAQTESLAVVTKAQARVPPECIEAIYSLENGLLLWKPEEESGPQRRASASSCARGDPRLLRARGEEDEGSFSEEEDLKEEILDSIAHCPFCKAAQFPGT